METLEKFPRDSSRHFLEILPYTCPRAVSRKMLVFSFNTSDGVCYLMTVTAGVIGCDSVVLFPLATTPSILGLGERVPLRAGIEANSDDMIIHGRDTVGRLGSRPDTSFLPDGALNL